MLASLPGLAACGDIAAPPEAEAPSFAASPKGVLTVTSLADPGAGSCGPSCTLRQAIAAAENGNRIVFKNNLAGTIVLTAGELVIEKSIEIDGGGRITIDAQRATRVIRIEEEADVILSGLTVTGGLSSGSPGEIVPGAGGGILNLGSLTVGHSRIVGNEGTTGGGIKNNGRMTIHNATISENVAVGAGGIDNTGQLTILRSTLSANAALVCGAIDNSAPGTLLLTTSTVSGNMAVSGGGLCVLSPATIRSSTFLGNGSGILASGAEATMANSIIGDLCEIVHVSGMITSLGHNLVLADSGCPGTGAGDVIVALAQLHTEVVEPNLRDNGGATLTHALIERGRAVDAGYCPGELADQRGFARPFDDTRMPNRLDGCDIGAFEWHAAPTRGKGAK